MFWRSSPKHKCMESNPQKHFFFVFGLPRTRSAWLSVLLSGQDAFCFHEGISKFATFEDFAAAMRARPETAVGNADSSLVYYLPEILAEFPEAQFLFVDRDPQVCLQSLLKAEPTREEEIRAWWPMHTKKVSSAVEILAEGDYFTQVSYEDLDSFDECLLITCWLRLVPLDPQRWGHLKDLRITTVAEPPAVVPVPAEASKPFVPHAALSVERLKELGFDVSGFRARGYGEAAGDYQLCDEWWKYHNGPENMLVETLLPPLGVVVEDADGPVAACWCIEAFGIGVGVLESPVTRPGIDLKTAAAACAFAAATLMQMAGKRLVPEGEFSFFRVSTTPGIARALTRMGFVQTDNVPRRNLIFRIPD